MKEYYFTEKIKKYDTYHIEYQVDLESMVAEWNELLNGQDEPMTVKKAEEILSAYSQGFYMDFSALCTENFDVSTFVEWVYDFSEDTYRELVDSDIEVSEIIDFSIKEV